MLLNKFNLSVLFILISFNYHTEQNQIIISGNWYNFIEKPSENYFYVETFISEDYFQYYTDFGTLMPRTSYYLKNDVLFKNNKEGKIVFLDDDTFQIINNDETITLKRIFDTITLENYINNDVSKNIYWEAFTRRRLYWEKHGMLPENNIYSIEKNN